MYAHTNSWKGFKRVFAVLKTNVEPLTRNVRHYVGTYYCMDIYGHDVINTSLLVGIAPRDSDSLSLVRVSSVPGGIRANPFTSAAAALACSARCGAPADSETSPGRSNGGSGEWADAAELVVSAPVHVRHLHGGGGGVRDGYALKHTHLLGRQQLLHSSYVSISPGPDNFLFSA
ncbi:hypothetical protein V8E52_008303 [Russula decolorans]